MASMIISQVAENMPNKIDKLIYVSAYLPKNGEDLTSITNKFLNNKPLEILEFNKDYSLVSIKKKPSVTLFVAIAPDYMKEPLVKYHRAEPVKGLNDKSDTYIGIPCDTQVLYQYQEWSCSALCLAATNDHRKRNRQKSIWAGNLAPALCCKTRGVFNHSQPDKIDEALLWWYVHSWWPCYNPVLWETLKFRWKYWRVIRRPVLTWCSSVIKTNKNILLLSCF